MSVGAIIAIVIAIIVVAAAAVLAAAELRHRALRKRFGPEYDRLVKEKGTKNAEAELLARQRRIADLKIRDLTPEQRAGYSRQWAVVQERFVDDPADSIRRADELIASVSRVRGYPADDPDSTLDALTVDHAGAVEGYRTARTVAERADGVPTEEYRQALLSYRALFSSLAGSASPASQALPAAPASPASPADADATRTAPAIALSKE
jgi:hypothetical protein